MCQSHPVSICQSAQIYCWSRLRAPTWPCISETGRSDNELRFKPSVWRRGSLISHRREESLSRLAPSTLMCPAVTHPSASERSQWCQNGLHVSVSASTTASASNPQGRVYARLWMDVTPRRIKISIDTIAGVQSLRARFAFPMLPKLGPCGPGNNVKGLHALCTSKRVRPLTRRQ